MHPYDIGCTLGNRNIYNNTRKAAAGLCPAVEGFLSMLSGCQGKPRTPTIIEKICPNCGSIIELFSIDTQMACETCGFIAYNDTLSCVQWCQYARKCVGDEMYDHMMAIAASQKERAAHLRTAPKKDSAQ